MEFEVRRAEYEEVAGLREGFRGEAGVQIVNDSILGRRLADAYLILGEGRPAGYGGVWNTHWLGRLMEFYAEPEYRAHAAEMYRGLIAASGAHEASAQTNLPLMKEMLEAHAKEIWDEKALFGDAFETELAPPEGVFRRAAPDEAKFASNEGSAEFVIERKGRVVASGGFLRHYNPPFADVFMEVEPEFRRQGYGSFFVQMAIRACGAAGRTAAARCDPQNEASFRTLQKGGFRPIGMLRAGRLS